MKRFVAANDHIIIVRKRICWRGKPDGLLQAPSRTIAQNRSGPLRFWPLPFFPQRLAGHDKSKPRMSGQRLVLRQALQQKRFSRPFAAAPDTLKVGPAFQSLQPCTFRAVHENRMRKTVQGFRSSSRSRRSNQITVHDLELKQSKYHRDLCRQLLASLGAATGQDALPLLC